MQYITPCKKHVINTLYHTCIYSKSKNIKTLTERNAKGHLNKMLTNIHNNNS